MYSKLVRVGIFLNNMITLQVTTYRELLQMFSCKFNVYIYMYVESVGDYVIEFFVLISSLSSFFRNMSIQT